MGFGGCQIEAKPIDPAKEEAELYFIRNLIESTNETVHINTGCTSELGGTINNADLLEEIYVAEKPMMMLTNAGKKLLTLQGKMPGIEKWMWYDPKAIGNVIAFSALHKLGY